MAGCSGDLVGADVGAGAPSITQDQIAESTGLSTSYVSRTLAEFSRCGILRYRWRKLIVIDPDGVAVAAGVDFETGAHWADRHVPLLPLPCRHAKGAA